MHADRGKSWWIKLEMLREHLLQRPFFHADLPDSQHSPILFGGSIHEVALSHIYIYIYVYDYFSRLFSSRVGYRFTNP